MPESEVPRHQEVHGVTTRNRSQAFVGTARDVYFAASHSPQEATDEAAVACRSALFLTDPRVDRESVISAKGRRVAGTCEWITRNAKYCAWLNGSNNDNTHLLWISGGPGKGKTMLSIFLIEELEKHAALANNTDLIFLFCSAEDDKRNTSVAVLRGLVHQILMKRPRLAKHILSYFEPPERVQQAVASLETLWLMFSKLVSDEELGTVFCVLDGLDECEETTLSVLLPRIVNLLSGNNLSSTKGTFKLVIVSRDIPGLQHCARVRLDPDNDEKVASDIELFVSSRVAELSRIEGFDNEFRTFTEKALLERAEGTFLWVGFAMHELSQKQTRTEILEALTNLPSGLPAIYSRMLMQIPAKQRDISQKILCWVTMAVRPLELRELAAAVDVQAASPQITVEQAVHDAVILCGPLLKIQQTKVSLVHQSARDYLLRKDRKENDLLEMFHFEAESAHLQLAQDCLSCIAKSGLQHRHYFLNELDNGESPLLKYAILCWPEHARCCLVLATALFDPLGFFLQKESPLRSHWWMSYRLATNCILSWISPPPLHIACFTEIMPWAEALLEKNKKKWKPSYRRRVNKKNKDGTTALHGAVMSGNKGMVQLLLSRKANIDAKNNDGERALHWAIRLGNKEMVELLLDKGADIEAKNNDGERALRLAARVGNEAVVQLLFSRGADIEAKNDNGKRTLHLASQYGNVELARQLIDGGADLGAKDWLGRMALHWASENGKVEVARLLIDREADLEAKDGVGKTALHLASQNRRVEVARLLVDRGANPRAKDNEGRSAAASS